MGRQVENKYENCTMISVPVDEKLARDLKIYCAKNGITMKEVMYKIVNDGIKEELRGK